MAKHPYSTECSCDRCAKEGRRREAQSTVHRMADDIHKSGRRGRIAREYWDRYESGAPMSSDDY